ncbi:unnamed protein product, partial [Cladocopium goreaui]
QRQKKQRSQRWSQRLQRQKLSTSVRRRCGLMPPPWCLQICIGVSFVRANVPGISGNINCGRPGNSCICRKRRENNVGPLLRGRGGVIWRDMGGSREMRIENWLAIEKLEEEAEEEEEEEEAEE